MKEILKKENRVSLIVSIVCLLAIGLVGSYTYSFFAVNKTNNSAIAGEAESLGLTVTVEQTAPEDSSKLIPQLDAYIDKAIIGRQGSCIDDNGNTVCHTYKVTLTNSNLATKVTGTLTLDNKNNPNLKWALYQNVTNGDTGDVTPTLIGDIKTPDVTALTTNEEYTAGQTKEYLIVVWISETSLIQTDSGNYSGVVEFTTVNDLENSTPSSQATALSTLTALGLENKINDTILTTFTATSKSDGTTGIYKTEDDLGDSYYFRGNVDYNYVKFGKYTTDVYAVYNSTTYSSTYEETCPDGGTCTQIASAGDDMYWRIVRINGDGTIRMIYAGTDAYANNATGVIRHIGRTAYNKNYDDNAYVGYMYGTAGSTTYDDTHENITNSTIKTMVDLWYDTYLETNYGQYIADAIYCNDRTISTEDSSYTGIGDIDTNYSPYQRVCSLNTPTLKCEQENDRFTKGTSVSGVTGNNDLTNPVGLITTDEMTFAGSYRTTSNDEMYLYDNNYYFWTMSPDAFRGGGAFVFDGGGARSATTVSTTTAGLVVRPFLSARLL